MQTRQGDGRRIKMVRYTNSVISTYLTSYTISLQLSPLQIQYKYNTNTTQIQHKYTTNTTQMQHKCNTNTTQMQHKYNTNATQIQHKYNSLPTSLATLFPCSSCLHEKVRLSNIIKLIVVVVHFGICGTLNSIIFIERGHQTCDVHSTVKNFW